MSFKPAVTPQPQFLDPRQFVHCSATSSPGPQALASPCPCSERLNIAKPHVGQAGPRRQRRRTDAQVRSDLAAVLALLSC